MQILKLIIFLLAFFLVECRKPSIKVPPLAVNGVLDLRDWDFAIDGIIQLDGEWEFYWNSLIRSEPNTTTQKTIVLVPSVWNNTVEGIPPRKAFGFASYRLVLKLNPEQKEQLYLQMQDFGTAGSLCKWSKNFTKWKFRKNSRNIHSTVFATLCANP
ncbi:MAG: hypothetical protein N3A69_11525 [Leptospiraceae bacterium]|nr:hypothetical protein [Leptospiraceae bacterium]